MRSRDPASPPARDAVFLHSSWRAGSTYVWSKFRERPNACCYFEPLNEHLAHATAEMIDGFRPWSFAHHPPLDAPYLEEFRPLIDPGGGVRDFPAHLALGRYCAGCDAHLPELETYLNGLAGHAARRGRRPVYGFVRTDMRVEWFRAQAPGVHVFIRREPRRQFLSMLGQAARGNVYFLERGSLILEHNKEEPAFAPLHAALASLPDSLGLRGLPEGGLGEQTGLVQLYVIFYFMRLLARKRGEAHCDLVIDIDRLSLEDSYRRDIETRLADLVGMTISFADCQVARYDKHLAWSGPFFDALERRIEAIACAATGRSS
ncbi:hypothetical protein [Methylocapsa sp. S129]|uniref:hypothetical protein n=1 Tax=Methylocapsa sp. S129 TaxID=1641869 RepID=UPI00131AE810|nr:hypothetical protein [Methylocapsa sp. S129]